LVAARHFYITPAGRIAAALRLTDSGAKTKIPDEHSMTNAPPPRPRRRILTSAVWIGWAAGVIATALGFTAPWLSAFDLINEARPLLAIVATALFVAAVALRDAALIRPTLALAVLQAGLLLLPWARAAATTSAAPALRLVTFDLGAGNDRFDDIADFILGAKADIVLLQEVSCGANDRLIPKLRPAYANVYVSADGCAGQAILAKRPWLSIGQVVTPTRKPLTVSARFQWDRTSFSLTGVSFAGPLAPNEQAVEMERLRASLANQGSAQIVAGSLNLTPASWKFAQLVNAGFGQHATYLATWSADWPLPAFLMDNVLSTDGIASVRISTGAPLGSDHRPLIADIAFVK
jgi:endonuclease/exonuclease/phosphatase (EEP) superfamily protein YafD